MIWNGTGQALMCCFVLSSLGLISILRSQRCFFLTSSHTRNCIQTKTHKITFTRLHTHPLCYTRIHSYTRIISPSLSASRTHAFKHPFSLFHAHTQTLFLSQSISLPSSYVTFPLIKADSTPFFFQIGSWSNSERQLDNIYQMEPVVRAKQFMPHRLQKLLTLWLWLDT